MAVPASVLQVLPHALATRQGQIRMPLLPCRLQVRLMSQTLRHPPQVQSPALLRHTHRQSPAHPDVRVPGRRRPRNPAHHLHARALQDPRRRHRFPPQGGAYRVGASEI